MSTNGEMHLIDLSHTELSNINGGGSSFAYDLGWAIRYLAYHGPGTGPSQWAAWEIQESAIEALQKD